MSCKSLPIQTNASHTNLACTKRIEKSLAIQKLNTESRSIQHIKIIRNLPLECASRLEQGTNSSRPPSRRGKALLQNIVRPAEDDPILNQISREINPVEAVSMVQWYPGHIAKAEKELKEQLGAVDIVIEVRDGRIPMSTRHPQIPLWIGSKPRIIILNRKDMVPDKAAKEWTAFFKERGRSVVWSNAQMGDGINKIISVAQGVSTGMNEKRVQRGLRPRPVRAVVVGFPNVGKSALINRLLGRRVADSAPRPGVTRVLKWARIGGDLDLLDAPGIIPMSFKDQIAAQRLAMCNDIGAASYVNSLVAAALLRTFQGLPDASSILRKVEQRYGLSLRRVSEEEFVHAVGEKMFNSEPERAGQRILKDFRLLNFGRVCLEMPESFAQYKEV